MTVSSHWGPPLTLDEVRNLCRRWVIEGDRLAGYRASSRERPHHGVVSGADPLDVYQEIIRAEAADRRDARERAPRRWWRVFSRGR